MPEPGDRGEDLGAAAGQIDKEALVASVHRLVPQGIGRALGTARMAAELGVNIRTLRTRVHYGLRQLRTIVPGAASAKGVAPA